MILPDVRGVPCDALFLVSLHLPSRVVLNPEPSPRKRAAPPAVPPKPRSGDLRSGLRAGAELRGPAAVQHHEALQV